MYSIQNIPKSLQCTCSCSLYGTHVASVQHRAHTASVHYTEQVACVQSKAHVACVHYICIIMAWVATFYYPEHTTLLYRMAYAAYCSL